MGYQFDQQVTRLLKPFGRWLSKKGYGADTIRQKINYAGSFLNWLMEENLQAGEVRYNDLLPFIDKCKLEGDGKGLINKKLNAIDNYYALLKRRGLAGSSPAQGLRIRGTVRKVPPGLTPFATLEKLYNSFETNTLKRKRDKAMLGLLIYQGLATRELRLLSPAHIDLGAGKITIPGGKKGNRRVLDLKPFQVMELYNYLGQVRPEIIRKAKRTPGPLRSGKISPQKLEEKLFMTMSGSFDKKDFRNGLHYIFRTVKKNFPIQNAGQIRASVISHWLKANNLRQVQYMAGHRHISSTERYQLGNLEKLQEKLEKLHPLNNT